MPLPFRLSEPKCCHADFLRTAQENSRRLELSISKNTPRRRWGQGPGTVDPRFSAGLRFPVPEILKFLGPAFGRTDFLRIFIFEPPDFFADFLAGFFFFFSSFLWEKCPEKSSRKIPGKILQNLYNKNPPTHFCRLPRARNPKICSISRFGKNFPAIFLGLSRTFPGKPQTDPGNSHSLLEFSERRGSKSWATRTLPCHKAGCNKTGRNTHKATKVDRTQLFSRVAGGRLHF